MKKIIIAIIITLLVLVGCSKKEENKSNIPWETDLTNKQSYVSEDALKVFNEATKDYEDKNLEVIALLGEQVVAGTNYMYLCKSDTYKIVIIYKNLDNKLSITSVNNLDYTQFVNKEIANENENLTGGWNTQMPEEGTKLSSKVQKIFNKATKELDGATYLPIATLGHQDSDGTNYAVLCYGKMITAEDNSGIYLLTLNENEKGTDKLVSIAYIDLGTFNN